MQGVLGKLPPIKHMKEPVPGAWPIFPSRQMTRPRQSSYVMRR